MAVQFTEEQRAEQSRVKQFMESIASDDDMMFNLEILGEMHNEAFATAVSAVAFSVTRDILKESDTGIVAIDPEDLCMNSALMFFALGREYQRRRAMEETFGK